MRSFRFSLEKVLAWRRTQLALQEADLELLRANLFGILASIAELDRRREAASEQMRSMRTACGADLAEIPRFRVWAEREEKLLRSRIEECEGQIQKRSAAIAEARRQVELVERMKGRRLETWNAEFNLELDQLAGESALNLWRREKSVSPGNAEK